MMDISTAYIYKWRRQLNKHELERVEVPRDEALKDIEGVGDVTEWLIRKRTARFPG